MRDWGPIQGVPCLRLKDPKLGIEPRAGLEKLDAHMQISFNTAQDQQIRKQECQNPGLEGQCPTCFLTYLALKHELLSLIGLTHLIQVISSR